MCVCVCVCAVSPVEIPVEEAQVSYIHLQQDSPACVTDLKSLHLTHRLKCRPRISTNRVIIPIHNKYDWLLSKLDYFYDTNIHRKVIFMQKTETFI